MNGDGEGEISADDNSNYPSNRLGRLCENVSKAQGPDVCTYCVGVCCGSMQDLINVLIDFGEAEPSQKVCLVFVCLLLCYICLELSEGYLLLLPQTREA